MIADFCELDCCIIFESSNIPFAKICVQRFNNTLANNIYIVMYYLIEKEGLFLFTESLPLPTLKETTTYFFKKDSFILAMSFR